jgi:putative MFS transporter
MMAESKGAGEVVDRKYMWTVFILASLGWMFDGLDQMLYSMVAPWIMKDWHLTTVEVGLIGSLFLIGHCSGNFIASTAADYIGRKPMMWLTPVVYSAFTGLAGLGTGVYTLGAARMLSGLGTGGQLPVGTTMLAENVPAKSRGRFTTFMNSAYSLGFFGAIAITSTIGVHFRDIGWGEWGWKICFFAGAIPGLILAVLTYKYIRESELWLKSREEKRATGKKSFTLFDLFGKDQIRRTVAGLIIYVGGIMVYWGVVTWAPTYLATQRGLSMTKMTGFMAIWVLGGLLGFIIAGILIDKIGRKPVLSIWFFGSALSSLAYGYVTTPTALFCVSPAVGFFALGISGPMATYASELFPTAMRATGMGFVGGMGRVAAIITPTFVGFLALKFGIGAGFYVFSLIAILTFILLVIVGPETKGIQFAVMENISDSRESSNRVGEV